MSLAQPLKQCVGVAATAYSKPTTPDLKKTSREVMLDCEAPATAVLVAARHLLGPLFRAWEPETFWQQMDVCAANRDKLMAAVALDVHPTFYWDYRVFGSTVLAFNNDAVHHDGVPRPNALSMAWGVFEAELVYALTDEDEHPQRPEFDDEPAAFAAATLLDEGIILAPIFMGFCDEALEKLLNPEAKKVHKELKEAWRAHPKTNLEHASFEDSVLGVQLARQADIHLYLVNRADALIAYLKKF